MFVVPFADTFITRPVIRKLQSVVNLLHQERFHARSHGKSQRRRTWTRTLKEATMIKIHHFLSLITRANVCDTQNMSSGGRVIDDHLKATRLQLMVDSCRIYRYYIRDAHNLHCARTKQGCVDPNMSMLSRSPNSY